eukprot:878689-Prymnesium_polylepis.1
MRKTRSACSARTGAPALPSVPAQNQASAPRSVPSAACPTHSSTSSSSLGGAPSAPPFPLRMDAAYHVPTTVGEPSTLAEAPSTSSMSSSCAALGGSHLATAFALSSASNRSSGASATATLSTWSARS